MELVKNIKHAKITKFVFFALLGTVLLAISSKIKIPFYPVPMTMQTLIVLLIGIIFGWKLGVATISLYLFEGIIGLPVFAGTPEKGIGLTYFTGPTMGYLLGFIPAVFFVGFFKINLKYNLIIRLILNFVLFAFSVSFIYIFGLLWLTNFVSADKVWALGALPFLPAEILKILILTVAVSILNKSSLSWRSFR
jgi:biotin transport system substrate-specific component